MAKIRLFIETQLHSEARIPLSRDHAHYLFNVMRLEVGARVLVFNGTGGEWCAYVAEAGRKSGALHIAVQTRSQADPPDIDLMFAPVKKARTDFIVEKACELGCRTLQPVFTHNTNSLRLNLDRLRAHMIEAAEQCGGLYVPVLKPPLKLHEVLRSWQGRALVFCNEMRDSPPITKAVSSLAAGTPVSVLIGPEGGFSPDEIAAIKAVDGALPVSLGPRILRADTAAVAALTVVQAQSGDW